MPPHGGPDLHPSRLLAQRPASLRHVPSLFRSDSILSSSDTSSSRGFLLEHPDQGSKDLALKESQPVMS